MDSSKYKCLPTHYTVPTSTHYTHLYRPMQRVIHSGNPFDEADPNPNDGGPPFYNDVTPWRHQLQHPSRVTGVDARVKVKQKHHRGDNGHTHEYSIKTEHRIRRKREVQESSSDEAREAYEDYYAYDGADSTDN